MRFTSKERDALYHRLEVPEAIAEAFDWIIRKIRVARTDYADGEIIEAADFLSMARERLVVLEANIALEIARELNVQRATSTHCRVTSLEPVTGGLLSRENWSNEPCF